ncbi:ubiquitin-protein ligase molybdopterin-converting factor [Epithele typhae]|uniref:ubiquitin-protein ligase molybdopterin-converting factor n=1 Tax=Epithele typhae TaxID=378194 RepID=UPI00200825E0|nr:ubiquitin-protein ligase molybdopterin-converting factor [Epithele typhae]KAH9928008.1 ubiquitin-protein ligase molybdopterin-converting factor [Epithele typhae]
MNLDSLQSHRVQLALTALGAAALTAGAFTGYQQYTKNVRRRHLAEDVVRSLQSHTNGSKGKARETTEEPHQIHIQGVSADELPPEYDEGLVREQLARNYAFFGDEGMARVRQGTVVIVGCGGVGSWAAVMLARSGVRKLRLVDFDMVTLSSLNRHATAVLEDVGTSKVRCVERTLKQISRVVEVDARVELWRTETGGDLLAGADWVVDGIDNVTTKVELLKYCHVHNIPVFSSMGSGAKCDPTRIQISDISYTEYDPLARSVRRRLRLEGVHGGIPVVYSTEVPGDVKLLPLPEEEYKKGNVKELGAFDDFRVRILPVLGPLPAIFGLNIATYIVCELAGKPISNPLPVKGRKKPSGKLCRDLQKREEKFLGRVINKLSLNDDDCGFLFDDIHRGRSIVPPHPIPEWPALVRWDPAAPLSLENVVAFEHADAERHLSECLLGKKDPAEVWAPEVVDVVKRRQEEVRRVVEWIM